MEKARCIKCGRPLRDPESIARGMGPECAGESRGAAGNIAPEFTAAAVLFMR
jgi:hypothetical protein